MSVGELAGRLGGSDAPTVLDVREAEELAIARIDGAVHLPLGDVPARYGELDPDVEYVVVCHHGVRSANAAGFLVANGFARVWNLTGGIDAWAAEVDPAMARY